MTDTNKAITDSAEGWDTYWQGATYSHAFSDSGVSHPVIEAFWQQFFAEVNQNQNMLRMIDIASGNGALLEIAKRACSSSTLNLTCVDASKAAIDNIGQRFPAVNGIVCDARSIPLQSGHFDIVTSQFGIEYAGLGAVEEAARLLAPTGQLRLMMHCSGSRIEHECQANLDIVDTLMESNFLGLAYDMFKFGFDAVRGGNREPYDEAATALSLALPVVEKLIAEHGQLAAGITAARLYEDIAKIHSRLPNYDPQEVLNWLSQLNSEQQAYADRMKSMISATVSAQEFNDLCDVLPSYGLNLITHEVLYAGDNDSALAWIIAATKEEEASR